MTDNLHLQEEYFVVTRAWLGSPHTNVFKASSPRSAAKIMADQLDRFKSIEVFFNNNRDLLATFDESDFEKPKGEVVPMEYASERSARSDRRFMNWYVAASCIFVAAFILFTALEPKTGEILYAEWYEVERNGELSYLFKESANMPHFSEKTKESFQELQSMMEEGMPGIKGTTWGYGAIHRKGSSGSGWRVFQTKVEAVDYLLQNGVNKDNIWEN